MLHALRIDGSMQLSSLSGKILTLNPMKTPTNPLHYNVQLSAVVHAAIVDDNRRFDDVGTKSSKPGALIDHIFSENVDVKSGRSADAIGARCVVRGPLKAFALPLSTFDAGRITDQIRRRTEDFFLLVHLERGVCDVVASEVNFSVASGDWFMVDLLQPLALRVREACDLVCVQMPRWWFVEYAVQFPMLARIGGPLQPPDSSFVRLLRATVVELLRYEGQRRDEDLLIAQFRDTLVRNVIVAPSDPGLGNTVGKMDTLMRLIASRFRSEKLSPRDAAQLLGWSLSTVHKLCASQGVTFNQILIDTRLSAAIYSLSRDRRAISDVAFECGFSSLSHFCRLFKQKYGVTPREVRARHLPH